MASQGSTTWTLSSAARFARGARITTVQHLRDTETAREVQGAMLTSSTWGSNFAKR